MRFQLMTTFNSTVALLIIFLIDSVQTFAACFFDNHRHKYHSECAAGGVHRHAAIKINRFR